MVTDAAMRLGRGGVLGEADLVDLRALVAAGESAETIAARFEVQPRTVERWRKELRRAGVTVRISEDVGAEGGGRRVSAEPQKPKKLLALPTSVEPMAGADRLHCERYNCDLSAQRCVERQLATARPGRNAVDQSARKVFAFGHCQSGECYQGALIKLRLGDRFVPPDPRRGQRHIFANLKARARLRFAPPAEFKPLPAIAPAKEQEMPRPSKLDDVSDVEVGVLHKKHGGDMKAIATEVGCSPATVSRRLESLGLHQRKPRGESRGAPAAKKVEKKANGHSNPAAPEGSAGAPGGRTRIALPAVGELPFEYLLACVEYARSAQQKLEKVLAA